MALAVLPPQSGGGRLDLFFVGGLADANALGMYSAASKIASVVVIVTNSYLLVLSAGTVVCAHARRYTEKAAGIP